jgi:hypothetical protein
MVDCRCFSLPLSLREKDLQSLGDAANHKTMICCYALIEKKKKKKKASTRRTIIL